MGNTIKKYWEWNEMFNLSEFRLRDDIDLAIKKGLIQKDPDGSNTYLVLTENPWHISTNDNNKIITISYRNTFFSIKGDNNIWNLDYNSFDARLSNILKPADENFEGDKICIFFRDYFVAVAVIIAAK